MIDMKEFKRIFDLMAKADKSGSALDGSHSADREWSDYHKYCDELIIMLEIEARAGRFKMEDGTNIKPPHFDADKMKIYHVDDPSKQNCFRVRYTDHCPFVDIRVFTNGSMFGPHTWLEGEQS